MYVDQRLASARSEPSRGREISGFEEMCLIRWSAAIRIRRSASQKRVSEGLWPGRSWTSSVRSRSSSGSPSARGRVTFAFEPQARKLPRHLAQRADHVLGDPVAQHQRRCLLVVALGVARRSSRRRGRPTSMRRHLGAGAPGDDVHQAEVVDVLVGDDHQLDLLDPVPERLELVLELVERLARVRPGVDQGQRLVLDQVAVDPADLRTGSGSAASGSRRRRSAARRRSSRSPAGRSPADQPQDLVALLAPCARARPGTRG